MSTPVSTASLITPIFRTAAPRGIIPAMLPAKGVTTDLLREIAPPLPAARRSRIVVVGCGVKIHFPWEKTRKTYSAAVRQIVGGIDDVPVDLIDAPEPFEDPQSLLRCLQAELAAGIDGIILIHAAYTAGELGSQLGRWLIDHPTPLLSWSLPDAPAERLEANSFCCQNFLLGMFKRMSVPYAWMHNAVDDSANATIARFTRTAHAKALFRKAKLLHIGGSRVSGFYDGETDELSVMRRFGAQFDRIDLQAAFDRARKFKPEMLARIRDEIVNSPMCSRNDVPDAQIFQTLRLGLAALDMAAEQGYTGVTVKSWPELFDQYGCATDGAVSMLNDLGLCTVEEGEMNGLLSSLALQFLSNGDAVPTLMDLSGMKADENRVVVWHCGACPTRWVKRGTKYQTTKHSILENADPATAVGMMIEFLLELGPVTIARYQSPDAAKAFFFEGNFVEAEQAFRGAYAEMVPTNHTAEQIVGTILGKGLDHHWSLGFGHWGEDLKMLNHWLGVENISVSPNTGSSGLSS